MAGIHSVPPKLGGLGPHADALSHPRAQSITVSGQSQATRLQPGSKVPLYLSACKAGSVRFKPEPSCRDLQVVS